MNTDTQTLTDTEPMQPELVPVLIIEHDIPGVGPCYCTSIEAVTRALEEILGEDAESGDWSWWPEDGNEPCIRISRGQRAKTYLENLPNWEI